MSLDIRYLTNGKKEIYTVRDSSAETFDVYEKREDIPKSIIHYVPDKVMFAGPDLARVLGALDVLYPNFPKCGLEGYTNKLCIGDSCRFCDGLDKDYSYTDCPYFDNDWTNKTLED